MKKSTGTFSGKNCRMISHRNMFLSFFPVILIGSKKFTTLLLKNWLAKTPQALVPRRLDRQSAERERISEIS
ncbi:hypothetical protein KEH51_08815 [[Brevibacterium] frigoritolerans]|uniref:Uncharacterized protein n=1 Tax=Peribacillus frigoritolerans TaxID=450367 RepID=A0A941FQD5_9BACI|nr:hypothetical protein [Peribacillus frigoritolerans]